jgi:hypothetical protein
MTSPAVAASAGPARPRIAAPSRAADPAGLPARVRRIVLHTLGGPFYRDPARRWAYRTPPETFALWRPRFGAHWIVWTDGTLWPRHPRPGEPASVLPPTGSPADAGWRARLAREAAPVYSHTALANSRTLGIELAHSGRAGDPFPEPQARTAAWLLGALLEMSEGRLRPEHVIGHKDLDRRPAYVREGCARPSCPSYADEHGQPFRRRVDPPEALFAALARHGLLPADRVPGVRDSSGAAGEP